MLEEELPGYVTYRNYRAPGRYSKLRKHGVMGSIALTDRRLLVWANHVKHVNMPHHDPLRAGIKVRVDQPDQICVSYDAGTGEPGMSGPVEVRLRTTRAVDDHLADDVTSPPADFWSYRAAAPIADLGLWLWG